MLVRYLSASLNQELILILFAFTNNAVHLQTDIVVTKILNTRIRKYEMKRRYARDEQKLMNSFLS